MRVEARGGRQRMFVALGLVLLAGALAWGWRARGAADGPPPPAPSAPPRDPPAPLEDPRPPGERSDARLEARAAELFRFGRQHPQRYDEQARRWDALARDPETADTRFATLARTMIETVQRRRELDASAALPSLALRLRRCKEWAAMRPLYRRYLAAYAGSSHEAPLRAELGSVERLLAVRERSRGWLFADLRPRVPRTRGAELTFRAEQAAYDRRYSGFRLHAPGGSWLEAEFTLTAVPRTAHLDAKFTGLKSKLNASRPFNPLRIEINGRVLVDHWSPIAGHHSWEITSYLLPGRNRLRWTLREARTALILRGFGIAAWRPFALPQGQAWWTRD